MLTIWWVIALNGRGIGSTCMSRAMANAFLTRNGANQESEGGETAAVQPPKMMRRTSEVARGWLLQKCSRSREWMASKYNLTVGWNQVSVRGFHCWLPRTIHQRPVSIPTVYTHIYYIYIYVFINRLRSSYGHISFSLDSFTRLIPNQLPSGNRGGVYHP